FTTDVLQPTQQKATEPTRFFDLAKYWLDDDLASGVQRAPCRGAHFRCHALLRRGRCGARLGFRLVVLLAPPGDVGVNPAALQRLHGSLAVIAIIQGRRDQEDVPRGILGRLYASLRQDGQGRLRQRYRLLFVIRRVGDVTGQDDLIRPVHAGLRVATVIPPLVVGTHDMQLWVRKTQLGFVVGGLLNGGGACAATLLPSLSPLGLRFGSTCTLGLRFRLRLRFQPSHRFLNFGYAVLAARQLGGQFIPAPAAQRGLLRLVLLVGRRHQGLNL